MKLRLTLRAEADLNRIAAYIQARNPPAARRVEAELHAAFQLIAAHPWIGHTRARGVRRFALPRYPYLIFYGVDERVGEVRVFTVRHAARAEEN